MKTKSGNFFAARILLSACAMAFACLVGSAEYASFAKEKKVLALAGPVDPQPVDLAEALEGVAGDVDLLGLGEDGHGGGAGGDSGAGWH